MVTLPTRLARELTGWVARRKHLAMRFDYRRLNPNLEEYLDFDSDAFVSMDPHAAIHFFLSRGYLIESHPGLFSRLRARWQPIIVRKPHCRAHARKLTGPCTAF